MPRCPIVKPEELTIPLSGDDFIVVKRRLNAGEYRDMLKDNYRPNADGTGYIADLSSVGVTTVRAYLLGWSFVDFAGQPLPVDRLLTIDPNDFQEVREAVEAHHAKVEAEADARKKMRGGEEPLPMTSPSAA